MKYLKHLTFLFLIVSTLAACSNDDDANTDNCFTSENTAADAVDGPETTTINTPITLNVTLKISNSCGEFIEFIETEDFPKEIYARVDYRGCTCADVIETITEPYVFEASTPGQYNLNFVSSDGLFIVKTITVTE